MENPKESFEYVNDRLNKTKAEFHARFRRQFLEALDGAFSSGRRLTQPWLDAIVESSRVFIDANDETSRALVSIDNVDRLRWIVIHGLQQLDDVTRVKMVLAAIEKAEDLTLLADILRTILGDVHPEGSKSTVEAAGFGEESNQVRSSLLSRVRSLAESSSFWDQARPPDLIWFWWGCDKEAEVKEFTARSMQSSEGLRALLHACVNRVRSSSGDYDSVNRKTWSKVVDLEKLERIGKAKLDSSTTSVEDRVAVQRFLSALEVGDSDGF